MENEGKIESVPAQPLGMLLCDAAWRDPSTGKMFLLGLFTDIRAPAFPCRVASITVYLVLTGIHGKAPVKISLVRVAEDDEVILEAETEVPSPDPLAVVELPIGLLNVAFEQPGEYRCQLWAGKEPNASCVLERRIVVLGQSQE